MIENEPSRAATRAIVGGRGDFSSDLGHAGGGTDGREAEAIVLEVLDRGVITRVF